MNIVSTYLRYCVVFGIVVLISTPLSAQYWEKLATPPSAHYPAALPVAKILITSKGTYLCATQTGSGVYRSTNRGTSWITASPYANYDHGLAFCVNPAGDIFVATNNANGGNDLTKIGRSKDDGVSYQNVPSYPQNATLNSMICTSNGTILIGTNNDGIYRSKDDGATWSLLKFKSPSDSATSCLLDAGNGTIYAGTKQDGIYVSKDYGDTWNLLFADIYLSDIKCMTSDKAGNIYVGTAFGVYKSSDGGKIWNELFSTGNSGSSQVSFIFVSPQGRIFVGVIGSGAYCTIDNGKSWTKINSGTITNNVNTMAIDSTGKFLMGTANDIYRNTDAAVLSVNVDVNTLEVNLGDITYPEQKDSIISITNIGDATLEVAKLVIKGLSAASFQVIPSDAFSLEASQSKNITIHCKPVKNGDLEASLEFTSNTAGETTAISIIGFSSGVNKVEELRTVPFTLESFPNPSADNGMIKVVSETTAKGMLNIVNILGVSVYSHEFSVEAGSPLLLRCDIPSEAAGGLYQAIITIGQHTSSIPMTIVR
ncbi:MAG: hypothetical protein HYZ54_05795 [Ignavibacteriae bacterium]|nr:hypothetical protein [Ignavibacteriota bacterium]